MRWSRQNLETWKGALPALALALLILSPHAERARVDGATGKAPASRAPNSVNRALALTWPSAAETRFDARRLAGEHTTQLRFMAAYDAAFRGVVLADGSGSYHLGMAPYGSLDSAAIEIVVGGATFTHPLAAPVLTDNDFRHGVPRQVARPWRHLAVTRRGRDVTVYLDGGAVGSFLAGETRESGALRFGRLRTPGGVQDQFYGFVDDVALFSRALDAREIAALARSPRLANDDARLLASWSFDSASAPGLTLSGSARLSEVSRSRDASEDSAILPAPAHRTRFTLPFAKEQVWMVSQGINSGLSHHDIAAFAVDFIRVDPRFVASNATRLPGGSYRASVGQPIVAPADGTVAARVDCFPDDNRDRCPANAYPDLKRAPPAGAPANRNLLCLDHGAGEYSCVLHLRASSVSVAPGERVERGRELARVGMTGVRSVHLHFAVGDRAEPSEPGAFNDLVTFPVAFSDYFASSDFGATWRRVEKGVPRPGEWLRRADSP